MVVFSDFECPFCGSFARDTMPQLERDYVTSGRLQIAYRYLPLDKHPHALGAARGAECAKRQGHFWPMHDLLFTTGAELDPVSLHATAASLNLDDASYTECLDEPASHEAVSRDLAQARALGVESTPAFLLGSRLHDGRVQVSRAFYGALSLQQFRTEVERALRPSASSRIWSFFSWSGVASEPRPLSRFTREAVNALN